MSAQEQQVRDEEERQRNQEQTERPLQAEQNHGSESDSQSSSGEHSDPNWPTRAGDPDDAAAEDQQQDDRQRFPAAGEQPLGGSDKQHREGRRDVGDEGEEQGSEPPRGNET